MAQAHRPSSSGDLLFEALLKQGCAAEKAARIAHIGDPLGDDDDDDVEAAMFRRSTASKEDMIEVIRKG